MTRDDMIDEEGEAFYERHERAKTAARSRAKELLRTPEGGFSIDQTYLKD